MIRPYREEDLPAVMALADRAWEQPYALHRKVCGDELFEALKPNAKVFKGLEVARGCRKRPACVRVCEEQGVIVGFITFLLDEEKRIGEIGNNGVDPACRGRGVGQQMYQAVLALFRERGMRFAKVTTGLDDGYAPARRAYERAGFNIRVESVTYYQKL